MSDKKNQLEMDLIKQYKNSISSIPIDTSLFDQFNVKRGLRNRNGTGVLAGLTRIGEVFAYYVDDGEKVPVDGKLFYNGHEIKEVVQSFEGHKYGFEKTAYLLLFGTLPTKEEMTDFNHALVTKRVLPKHFIEDMIFKAPSKDIMNKLARTVLTLYAYDDKADDTSIENVLLQSIDLIAKMPLLVSFAQIAKVHYIDDNALYVKTTKPEYSTAETILYLIRPDGIFTKEEAELLDLILTVHAEHGGGNNSTFTTRCVTSTGTDTYAAIAAGISSLKGPQHGGASIRAYEMMQHIKENVKDWSNEEEIKAYLTKILKKEVYDRSGLIYGVGHAIYTLSDPRANILRDRASVLAKQKGKEDEYYLYTMVEKIAPKVFAEVKGSDKIVCANVDFYSGFIYSMLGLPKELFTPIFATARVAGWCAHRLEELISGGRIFRPAYKNVLPRKEKHHWS